MLSRAMSKRFAKPAPHGAGFVCFSEAAGISNLSTRPGKVYSCGNFAAPCAAWNQHREDAMNRRNILNLSVIVAVALAAPLSTAVGQQKTIKEQIVGTWTFGSALDVQPDGKKTDRWGPNPKGIFMFDSHGHFAQFITRSDLPKFAAGTADKGTAEETKAVLSGFVASFGTYTVDETEKTVITHVEGSVFPNLVGRDQKRSISTLTADELKYTNPTTSTGTMAEATWRRVK